MPLRFAKKIPAQYLCEFLSKQIAFIKSRVRLFCLLTLSIYFFATFLWFVIYPAQFYFLEVIIGLFLLAGSGVVLYLSSRANTIRKAQFNAYLFTALLLSLMVKLAVTYHESALICASIFVFTMFLVSVTIPWTPTEVIFIGFMHVLAYTVNFIFLKYSPRISGDIFSLIQYFDGLIFLSMSFFLCVVIRRKETNRDIDNFVLLKEIEGKSTQMRKELEWATKIHKTIIPDSISNDRVDMAVSYLPVYYMGGDYVKFEFLKDDRVIFIITDVTGHGVSAALLVNRIHAEFEQLTKEGKDPGILLKELNEFIKEDFEGSDMYLSAFCGLIDFKKMSMLYSNYGHPIQYLYSRKDSQLHRLVPQASLLGLPIEDNNVYQDDIDISAGDKVLLFTDGIIETVNKEGEEYGTEKLENFLKHNHQLPSDEFNNQLLDDVKTFKHGKFKDDICLLSMGIKGPKPLFF
ncbi:MAG: PP2C family protein-serine/threonine phosphatase [Candidatus Omnitrophota bacterium]